MSKATRLTADLYRVEVQATVTMVLNCKCPTGLCEACKEHLKHLQSIKIIPEEPYLSKEDARGIAGELIEALRGTRINFNATVNLDH